MESNGIAGRGSVHVIDRDSRRRAEISRDLIARDHHAEIFEDSEEFLAILPEAGSILIMEQAAGEGLAQFLEAIRNRGRYYPVSVYADAPRPQAVAAAMRAGAVDYLVWPFDSALLDATLDHLAEAGSKRRRLEQVKARARTAVEQLTAREHDVLLSLLNGNSNKQIAAELELSPRTVEIYRKNVMRKLDAKSTPDAVRIGIYADLWDVPAA